MSVSQLRRFHFDLAFVMKLQCPRFGALVATTRIRARAAVARANCQFQLECYDHTKLRFDWNYN